VSPIESLWRLETRWPWVGVAGAVLELALLRLGFGAVVRGDGVWESEWGSVS